MKHGTSGETSEEIGINMADNEDNEGDNKK